MGTIVIYPATLEPGDSKKYKVTLLHSAKPHTTSRGSLAVRVANMKAGVPDTTMAWVLCTDPPSPLLDSPFSSILVRTLFSSIFIRADGTPSLPSCPDVCTVCVPWTSRVMKLNVLLNTHYLARLIRPHLYTSRHLFVLHTYRS